jgi:hypothetical protein
VPSLLSGIKTQFPQTIFYCLPLPVVVGYQEKIMYLHGSKNVHILVDCIYKKELILGSVEPNIFAWTQSMAALSTLPALLYEGAQWLCNICLVCTMHMLPLSVDFIFWVSVSRRTLISTTAVWSLYILLEVYCDEVYNFTLCFSLCRFS